MKIERAPDTRVARRRIASYGQVGYVRNAMRAHSNEHLSIRSWKVVDGHGPGDTKAFRVTAMGS